MSTMSELSVFTMKEAAEFIGVTEARICQLIAEGEIRASRFGQRNWMISGDEVRRYADRPRTRGGRPRISDSPKACDKTPQDKQLGK